MHLCQQFYKLKKKIEDSGGGRIGEEVSPAQFPPGQPTQRTSEVKRPTALLPRDHASSQLRHSRSPGGLSPGGRDRERGGEGGVRGHRAEQNGLF